MKLLIAEDDFISRGLLENMLKTLGHDVLSAENGREAWALFKAQPVVNMVITDWDMPEMDGIELCRRIRKYSHEQYCYIVLLTAKDQKEHLVEVFRSGADDYIAKPFDAEELQARIKTGERVIRLEEGHRLLQQTLLESRDKLKVVLDSLQEEIVAVNDAFQIVSVNRAYATNRNLHYEEVIGKPFFGENQCLIDGCPPGPLPSMVRRVFETGATEFLESAERNVSGSKRFEQIHCLPVTSDTGRVFQAVIVLRDITEENQKQEQIRALNKELRQALDQIQSKNSKLQETLKSLKESQNQILQSEKMASIGQLAAGVAHEINNPTGFVSSNLKSLADYQDDLQTLVRQYRGLAQAAKESVASGNPASLASLVSGILSLEKEVDIDFILDDMPALIQESREGADRIKKIVIDLKDFAHPGEDEIRDTDVNANIDATLNIVWNEIKYKATVSKNYASIPRIQCYPQQLNQVFMNILVNAAQAIDGSGHIDITTRDLGPEIEIVFSDSGNGILPEHIDRVFDPFFTTKPVGKGTGLGLNVAYNIVRKHHGTIEAKSGAGEGTTFTIRIPVRFSPEPAELPGDRLDPLAGGRAS